jgi:hypothetical protein
MSSDILSLLNRVARAMESVVPGLQVRAYIGDPVWLGESDDAPDDPTAGPGEWVDALCFSVSYQGEWPGGPGFESGSSGSAHERVLSVTRELMSEVQDLVAIETKEPWPVEVVNGRRNMGHGNATIEGNYLYMWYGDRAAPALKLPPVHLD